MTEQYKSEMESLNIPEPELELETESKPKMEELDTEKVIKIEDL